MSRAAVMMMGATATIAGCTFFDGGTSVAMYGMPGTPDEQYDAGTVDGASDARTTADSAVDARSDAHDAADASDANDASDAADDAGDDAEPPPQ